MVLAHLRLNLLRSKCLDRFEQHQQRGRGRLLKLQRGVSLLVNALAKVNKMRQIAKAAPDEKRMQEEVEKRWLVVELAF